jgi:hypothetical protein
MLQIGHERPSSGSEIGAAAARLIKASESIHQLETEARLGGPTATHTCRALPVKQIDECSETSESGNPRKRPKVPDKQFLGKFHEPKRPAFVF